MARDVHFRSLCVVLVTLITYQLWNAFVYSQLHSRINSLLHAMMQVAMCAMILGLGWPVLPQVIMFALATLWFVIQAFSHRSYLECGKPHRISCMYSAIGTGFTVLMILPTGPLLSPSPSDHSAHQHPAAGLGGSVTLDGAFQFGAWFFLVATVAFSLAATHATIRFRRNRTVRGLPAPRPIVKHVADSFSAGAMALMLQLMA